MMSRTENDCFAVQHMMFERMFSIVSSKWLRSLQHIMMGLCSNLVLLFSDPTKYLADSFLLLRFEKKNYLSIDGWANGVMERINSNDSNKLTDTNK